jgi:hypothetical protein
VVLGSAVADGTDEPDDSAEVVVGGTVSTLDGVAGWPVAPVALEFVGGGDEGATARGVDTLEFVAIVDGGLLAFRCDDPPHPVVKATRSAADTHATAWKRTLVRS